jgi:acyl-homoserine-lactone acylase
VLLAVAGCAGRAGEILWDRYGVPHIYGQTEPELFRGFGYAQMQSHGNLLLRLYGQARGRAAEYWGDRYLTEDVYVRTMGIPARAATWYEQQDPGFRANLDAFADGLNQYAALHGDALADSLEVVLPITGPDLLAHAQRVVHFTFVHGFDRIGALLGLGSNTWAISPARSASGHAMLLANPHLPWADFFLFYEAHLSGAGLDLSGATLVGFPVIAIGFNRRLGWSHTVNTYDGADRFRLVPLGAGYRWDGAERAFGTRTETIRIKAADGTVRDSVLTMRSSVHGPIITPPDSAPVALRVAGLDQPGMLRQWWDMGRATTLVEFETALRTLQIPMFNVMYADADGHILYQFGGRVPVRHCCDVAHWAADVAGDSSAGLWNETLTYEQLPRLVDPTSGWRQNANDPPWTSTLPAVLRPDSFPAWLAPSFMHFRAQRSARMLAQDSSITFDELVQYKHSTRMELADRLLDELIEAARATRRPSAVEAADVLAAWDRQAQPESRGAVLFTLWIMAAGRAGQGSDGGVMARPWSLDSALSTPRGLRDPAAAARTLEQVAAQVRKQYGALDVPWGEVMRIRHGGQDLPGNGADGDPMGVFRVAGYVPAGDGKFRLAFGDTYYAAVEFGPTQRARVLLAYGNSTQPGSPHRTDQLPLFARQEMRDAWRSRADIEANLERREPIPGPTPTKSRTP